MIDRPHVASPVAQKWLPDTLMSAKASFMLLPTLSVIHGTHTHKHKPLLLLNLTTILSMAGKGEQKVTHYGSNTRKKEYKPCVDDNHEAYHRCDTRREVPVCKVSQSSMLKFRSFDTGVKSMDMCILIPPMSPRPHKRRFNRIAPARHKVQGTLVQGYMGTCALRVGGASVLLHVPVCRRTPVHQVRDNSKHTGRRHLQTHLQTRAF